MSVRLSLIYIIEPVVCETLVKVINIKHLKNKRFF